MKPGPGKSPLIAALVSLMFSCLPGAGQVYAGRLRRGIAFMAASCLGGMGLLYAQAAVGPGVCRWLMTAAALGWWGFLAYDAYRCAQTSPPSLEEISSAASLEAAGGLLPLPSFDAATPNLRRAWALTRGSLFAFGACLALAFVLMSLFGAALAVKAGSLRAAASPLVTASLAGALLFGLAERGRRVYEAAVGPVPLPADRLRREVVSSLGAVGLSAGCVALGAVMVEGVYRDLRRKSDDAATRTRLAEVRKALSAARSDEFGLAPADLAELTPRYLAATPPVTLRLSMFRRLHPDSNAVRVGSAPTDEGGWLYDAAEGAVFVNCTHTDAKRNAWNGY